ncbi:MAG: hypothetical protein H7Z14_11100 [Anaerolineae bacterium]|nr:hypothetical protein [Phycisphaerae bacterium]
MAITLVAVCGATTKPSDVLNTAVAALVVEYQAVLKDPEKPIRVECDFFKQNPPSVAITQANILPLLERTGGDVRVESYVKWQLLSAFDGKFDEAIESRAINIYRRAANLMLRPGVSETDRIELDKAAKGQLQDSLDRVDQKLMDAVGKFNAYNAQLLRYRNDLYARLPVRYESLLAGLDDAAQRLANGIDDIDTKPFVATLIADTRTWAATKPDARQLHTIGRGVSKLASAKGPVLYGAVGWSAREQRLVWTRSQRDLNFNGELQQLANELNHSTRASKPD